MLKYIIRRVLYMVPTVFGVILITFILFNVAGGDPAAQRLGKQATPLDLEEYDRLRGFNKPLVFGWWGSTRAHEETDFSETRGTWRAVEGAVHADVRGGVMLLEPNADVLVPLAFELEPGVRYRWSVVYRPADGKVGPGITAGMLRVTGTPVPAEVTLEVSRGWTRQTVEFITGDDAAGVEIHLLCGESPIHLRSTRLQFRVANPFDSQLVFYLNQIRRFDFGVSLETNQRVSRMILDGVLPSLALTTPIFLIGLVTAVSLALICAFFRNTFIDRFFVVFSVTLMSVNYLVWIVFGQYVLGYVKNWFPVWGFESPRYLLLPALIGIVSGLGGGLRFYRTIMLDEMYRDYVRTAFAKGVGHSGVLFRHVLKNAMIPILTSVVMTIPFLYTGSMLLESFFGIPGMGNMTISAINSSDVDVIRAVVFVGSMIYVVANLLTDISYTLVDPRVRLK